MSENEAAVDSVSTPDLHEAKVAAVPRETFKASFSADSILKLTIAFAALLAGIGIFYYFVVHLPARDRAEQAATEAAAAAKLVADAKAAAEERATTARQEAAKQAAYTQCIALAESAYSRNWDRNCASTAEAQQEAYYRCLGNNFGSTYCAQTYPALPRADCRLSTNLANSINKTLEDEKARCVEAARSGLV